MPLAFGALREGDIRLCAEGKVTRISLSSNLYWSMIGPVLVTRRTSIGQRAKQYCLLLVTSTGQLIDQYWSHHPLLRVRCEVYVYEGIVRDALRG